jgi:hypothetical protein
MKTHLKIALLTLLLISASGACMSIPSLNPFKKEVVLMSPLKGTLLKDGKPLANVEIEVVIEALGEERIYKHSTDANGNFDLPMLKDTMTLGPMTEFVASQFVFVVFEGEKQKIWSAAKREPELFAERYPAAETIGLTCDLINERETYDQRAGYIMTLCKWKSIRKV